MCPFYGLFAYLLSSFKRGFVNAEITVYKCVWQVVGKRNAFHDAARYESIADIGSVFPEEFNRNIVTNPKLCSNAKVSD